MSPSTPLTSLVKPTLIPSPSPSLSPPPTPSSPSCPSSSAQPDPSKEPPLVRSTITALHMRPHTEGGFFAESFRDPRLIPSPFPMAPASQKQYSQLLKQQQSSGDDENFDPTLRNPSTTIFYLLTPRSPQGYFHRNRGTTLHTLHRGRGRYVVIHPLSGEEGGEGGGGEKKKEAARIETFVVGRNAAAGERSRWFVEGGRWKATFLLPDRDHDQDQEGRDGEVEGEWEGEEGGGERGRSESGLLVSETVMPGFEMFDHEFLVREGLEEVVGRERAGELEWLVKE